MNRMLQAQVGAGWSKWVKVISDEKRLAEERSFELALEARDAAESHYRNMKEQWDRLKENLETVSA